MANNLEAVIPRLLVQGLRALRENAVTVQYVNSTYSALAGQKGSTIDVPIPSAIPDQDVVPANIAPNPADMQPTFVPIPMSWWREAPFQMSDKDMLEAVDDVLPMQASEAIKSLANYIDRQILGLYPAFYGVAGSAGVTPFSDGTTKDGTEARKVLNKQLAPMNDRWGILDPDAEAAAIDLRAFQDYSWNNSTATILEGKIEQRLGIGWAMNQNVLTHEAGSASGYTVNGVQVAGVDTLLLTAGSGDFAEGDIVYIAGQAQSYTVTAAVAGPASAIGISPSLRADTVGGEAITSEPDHVVNIVMQRNAIGFASRPLQQHGSNLGVISSTAIDPISGLTLRVEVKHEHKRLRWSYDILAGAAVLRPELGVRLLG